MSVWRDIGVWLYRLLPGNPILVRVVAMGGKRRQHLWARLIYLVVLFLVLLVMGAGLFEGGGDRTLAELAKSSTQTFFWVSLVQLFLVSFIAPVFCAGAITQEKDANTYHILLTTPLTNAQIVLGSLFSRIAFVWALLLAGLPIFCTTMIYGGVTTAEVFLSLGLAAGTALLTGSVAIMIAFLRVGTRRTLFAFFAGVAFYLLIVGLLGGTSYTAVPEAPRGPQGLRMSWLAPVHPFLALLVVTGQTPAPPPSDVLHYGRLVGWLLAHPAAGYLWLTTLASAVMVLISVGFVRAGAREGELTWRRRLVECFRPTPEGERRRKPRRVWNNPIAWREAATRASVGGRSLLRWVFLVGGIALGLGLLVAHYSSWGPFQASRPGIVLDWLTALLWIELLIVLLVVTNTAASTLTREKETQTIELLLATPLTSEYIVAGMLRGLVSFSLPLIAVPTATVALFVVAGLFEGAGLPSVNPLAPVLLPLLMVAYCAMAAMVGLYFSLVSRKTVRAVMLSTTVVMLAVGLLLVCGLGLQSAGPLAAAVVLPFTPLPAVQLLVDYPSALDTMGSAGQDELETAFMIAVFCCLASAAFYLFITYIVYRNMVRGFDMIVRRQSA